MCNGHRVVTEVKIYRDWKFAVIVNNRDVSKNTLGIVKLESSKKVTRNLFDTLNERILCKGFPVSCERIARDTKGQTVGITEEWKCGTGPTLHLRALNCRVLLQNNYKRNNNFLCDACSAVKRNCSAGSTHQNVNFGGKKRESYMSNDELKKKLQEEQTRRRNTERRLKYLKDKVENEMKSFGEDDHKDFLHMFQQVDRESLDEDMKIFWEAQEQALAQKNPNGHRWHPK